MIITCAQIQVAGKVIERSSHKARMTKLITSDETLEERVIAVGKKRNLHPVHYQDVFSPMPPSEGLKMLVPD